ncbi:MAG: SDR family NAD(P)-dependent oxidoreductase [Pseudomonadota bacterium]
MKTLSGKNIWLIGASSGIGETLAKELHYRGATLILSARSEDKLAEVRKNLGGQHHILPLDVSDYEAVKKAAEVVKNQTRSIDSVINLAAIYEPTAVQDIDTDFMHKTVSVNLSGMFHVVQSVLPMMREQDYGQIALCGSVAGYRGLPNGQPYSATKAAVINLAESIRAEEGDKLDIKLISPGFVETPMTDKNQFEMPMKIQPEEAAKAIADGLTKKGFEIHFPKKFTLIMKFIRLLPASFYFALAKKLNV